MRRYLPGLLDAGASSASTLIAGLAAARLLELDQLGAYALVFSTLLLAAQLPTQLVLVPSEARLVALESSQRVERLFATVRSAGGWSLVAGLATLAVGLTMTPGVDATARWMLGATGALAAFASPLQDHLRRMLHLAGRHNAAALVSLARLAIVTLILVIGVSAEIPTPLLPLGALALGDMLPLGSVLLSRWSRAATLPFARRELRRDGGWLLASASAAPAAGFLTSVIVTWLAGASSLGVAEAARIVAQPVLVLAGGVAAVLGPRAMEAAQRKDEATGIRLNQRFWALLTVAGLIYVGLTLLPDNINPLARITPAAFQLPWLAQLSVVAAVVNAMVMLRRSELVVESRTRFLAVCEAWAGLSRGVVASGATWWHAWTVPFGFLVGGFVRILLMRRHRG